MRRVIDIVSPSFIHPGRNDQIEHSENEPRNIDWYEEHANPLCWRIQDGSEQHCRNSPGSTKATVVAIIPVFCVGWYQAEKERGYVQEQVENFSHLAKYLCKSNFQGPSKEIQCDHIEDQMSPICMDQAATEEAVPLFVVSNGRGIEDKIIVHFSIAERSEGYDTGHNYDDQRNAH